ncbi:MAG: nucleoside deaminase [Alphaproteobacteria bacterium]
MTENIYMKRAIELAQKAFETDEVPIGALIVNSQTGEIISETHNLSEHSDCCTAHAEILAINQACQKLGSNRLWDLDLYVTLEPCTMCAAAISFARIKNLYFGAYDPKGGAIENGVKFFNSPTCHHKPSVYSGIMEEECSQILKEFFKTKRKKAT